MYLNFANRSTIWSDESSYQLYACSSVNYYQFACRMVLCENIFMRVVGASFRKKKQDYFSKTFSLPLIGCYEIWKLSRLSCIAKLRHFGLSQSQG